MTICLGSLSSIGNFWFYGVISLVIVILLIMVMVLIYLSVHNKISLKKKGIVVIIMIISAVIIGILYLLTISMNDSCQEITEPKKEK